MGVSNITLRSLAHCQNALLKLKKVKACISAILDRRNGDKVPLKNIVPPPKHKPICTSMIKELCVHALNRIESLDKMFG
jgi:hypothetical protein